MYYAGLIEERQVCNIVNTVELGRVHLGEGIERNLADLEPPRCEAKAWWKRVGIPLHPQP